MWGSQFSLVITNSNFFDYLDVPELLIFPQVCGSWSRAFKFLFGEKKDWFFIPEVASDGRFYEQREIEYSLQHSFSKVLIFKSTFRTKVLTTHHFPNVRRIVIKSGTNGSSLWKPTPLLRYLCLNGSSQYDPFHITKCQKLHTLILGDNEAPDFYTIESFFSNYRYISDALLQKLSDSCPQIESLTLNCAFHITNDGLSCLRKCKSLTHLCLSGARHEAEFGNYGSTRNVCALENLDEGSLNEILKLESLKDLKLCYTHFSTTSPGLIALNKKLDKLFVSQTVPSGGWRCPSIFVKGY